MGLHFAAQYGGLLPNLTINTNNTQQQAAAQTGNNGAIMNPNGNYPYSTFGFNQFSWFLNDIGRVDRGRTPWVIVAWHTPPYNSYSTHYKEFECGRLMIEPYLYANGVDIVMHGHVHAYERTYPINNYAVDQCGSRWITIGDGGNIEGLYKTFASQAGTSPCVATNNATYSNGCAVQSVTPSVLPQARAALLPGPARFHVSWCSYFLLRMYADQCSKTCRASSWALSAPLLRSAMLVVGRQCQHLAGDV